MAFDEIEIERSWVISALPKKPLIDHEVYHEIGYLFSEGGELRVYKKKMPNGWEYGITVKNEGDLSRREWEDKQFPEWAFDVVWPNTLGARVCKTRHFVFVSTTGQLVKLSDPLIFLIEIDEYVGNCEGLIRLECEFINESHAEAFVLPDWATDAIEVTHDSRFKGKNLASLSRKEFKELMDDLSLRS